jgi:hypothetical protein
MKKHTNFTDSIDYEQHPESTLVQMLWLAPGMLLVAYIVYKFVTT